MVQATFATHEVFNQSPPFEDVDLFAVDRPLVEAVVRLQKDVEDELANRTLRAVTGSCRPRTLALWICLRSVAPSRRRQRI